MVTRINKDLNMRGSGSVAAARMVFLVVIGIVVVASALPILD